MRISDWSSDVCSSDLVEAESVIELRNVDVGGPEVGAAPQHLGDPRLRLRVERVELGPAIAIAHRRTDCLDADRRVPERRSGEHTTELQSLLRRSYALFCLKKKKEHQYQYTQQKR